MAKAPKQKINKKETIQAVIERSKAFMSMYKKECKKHNVSISTGNGKLGQVANISIPPVLTCGKNCKECVNYCYAIRLYLKFGFDREDGKFNPWLLNYCIFLTDPERYFDNISKVAYVYRFFRWHTSGDIVNELYFDGMLRVAKENPHCEFLAFTKQYDIVNSYCDKFGKSSIPANLHILYSASPNVKMVNPYNFPECHIAFEDSTKDTFTGCNGSVYHCGGNCEECIANGCGCFNLHDGDVTIINQH